MRKRLLLSVIVLILTIQSNAFVLAKNDYADPMVKLAIKKYKSGNYTGCIQDCRNIVKKSPSNALAYYYLAMSYVQAGNPEEAIKNYAIVLSMKTNPKLKEYATTGKRCIETPEKCVLPPPPEAPKEELSDIDKFILSPSNLSNDVKKDFHQKHLDAIRNKINNDNDIDTYHLQRLNDSGLIKIAQNPTTEEINSALKVLQNAGFDTSSINNTVNAQNKDNIQQVMNYQNPELIELNALMGNNSQSNSNSMLNMIPYMLTQNKNGNSNYSPQLMQSIIMNSMMSNFNYNIETDNK